MPADPVRHTAGMDEHSLREWFGAYLADFVALGRGDTDDVRGMLVHYGLPAVVSTDAGSTVLIHEEELLGVVRRQIDGMRAAGYARSEQLSAATTVVNGTCALHRAAFARLDASGAEIGRIETTYLITDGQAGRRITGLLVHTAG